MTNEPAAKRKVARESATGTTTSPEGARERDGETLAPAARAASSRRAAQAAGDPGTSDARASVATEEERTTKERPAAALPRGGRAGADPAELLSADQEQDLDEQELDEEEQEAEGDDDLDELGAIADDDVPVDEMAEVTTDELWDAYRTESERLMAAAAAELGVAVDSPEVAARKRELTSPELERLRNELIERHYPLVRYIAERLLQTLPKSIELDDLISAGQFGLMDAIRGFDPDRGIKFKTYCSTRIRGSILDQLRSQDWVPRLVRIKWSRIERALQQLTGEYGREPTHAELARVLGMTNDELSRELGDAQAKAMFSLSEKWDDDEDGSIEKVEILEDHESIDPVRELNRRDLMRFITRSLTHKERFIIEQYYQYGHTMREIGEMLALTESRVCQIHSNVMGRLKGLLSKRESSLES